MSKETRSSLNSSKCRFHLTLRKKRKKTTLTGTLAADQSFGSVPANNPQKKQSFFRKAAWMVGIKDKSLLKAAAKGDLAGVHAALEKEIDIECTDRNSSTALNLAVEGQHRDVVSLLLQKGASQDSQNYGGWTPLMHACNLGDIPCVTLLLDHRANLNLSNKKGHTALCVAIESDQKQITRTLLQYPFDVNQGAPLALAAQLGLESIVSDLVKADGMDVRGRDEKGFSALAWAVHNENERIAGEILQSGLEHDMDEVDSSGRTVLHRAVEKDSNEMTKYLLDNHAKIQETSLGSPLHFAVKNGNKHTAQLLMLHGADINHEREGITPVWLAVSENQTELLQLLLSHEQWLLELSAIPQCSRQQKRPTRIPGGPRIRAPPRENSSTHSCLFNHLNITKCNIMHMAVAHGAQTIAEILFKLLKGACVMDELIDLSITLWSRKVITTRVSILHIAAAATGTRHATRMVKFLCLSGKINVNRQTDKGMTALHIAAFGHHLCGYKNKNEISEAEHTAEGEQACKLVRYLVRAPDVKLNVQNEQGRTPLHLAVEYEQHEIARILLEAGADPNIGDNDPGRTVGRTPLHYAANDGLLKTAKLIISYGGDKLQKDWEGTTAAQLLGGEVDRFYGPRELIYDHSNLSWKFL